MMHYVDPDTNAEVTRLTSYRAHSNHLYFTNNCFYDNGRRIVFESDRGNALNYYSMELQTGKIEQLTDLEQRPYPAEFPLHEGFVDATKQNCLFFYDLVLYRLSLRDRSMVPIYRIPDGFIHHILSVSCDGENVYTSIIQSAVDRSRGDLPLRDIMKTNPHSMILRIPVGGGKETVLWEEDSFIAHVNVSPTDANMLTFCHEGPWDQIDHRLWSMDMSTGTVIKLHPCEKDEVIGHEYWFADGKRIGYHGHYNGCAQLGSIYADGTCDRTYAFPFATGHIFSQDERLIVGDGGSEGKYLRIWRLLDEGYEDPRALCSHNCSFRRQRAHVHPRITPDGKSVLYTSDETGYEQLYLAKLPEDLTDLPMLSDLRHLGAK